MSFKQEHIFWGIGAWLGLGVMLACFWLCLWLSDWLSDWRTHKRSLDLGQKMMKGEEKGYLPFTAGKLNDSDGNFRAFAFGIKMLSRDPLPKPGSKIHVKTGKNFETFTVKFCETLTRLGTGTPEKGEADLERSPEVYVLIEEKLSDAQIQTIRETFGVLGFDPKRLPTAPEHTEQFRKPKAR